MIWQVVPAGSSGYHYNLRTLQRSLPHAAQLGPDGDCCITVPVIWDRATPLAHPSHGWDVVQ